MPLDGALTIQTRLESMNHANFLFSIKFCWNLTLLPFSKIRTNRLMSDVWVPLHCTVFILFVRDAIDTLSHHGRFVASQIQKSNLKFQRTVNKTIYHSQYFVSFRFAPFSSAATSHRNYSSPPVLQHNVKAANVKAFVIWIDIIFYDIEWQS